MTQKKKKGYFITFEGIDGCGKSTQLDLTAKLLKKEGINPLVLREPGSTPLSERVRKILLDKKLTINPLSELLLYESARAELVREIIGPAIENGQIVVCDRFYDSTTAYQGYGRKLDISLIEKLNDETVGKYKPNLTFLIDVDLKTSLLRRKKEADRLEKESKTFFNRVRRGFLETAKSEPKRIIIIDGRQLIEKIFDEIKVIIVKKLKL
ncbi:MAG: dTMP kinase [Candidatus Zixiibacteriota bacterium]